MNRVGAPWVTRDASFRPGSVCSVDVSSTDLAGSRDFYRGLFGWTYQVLSHPGRERQTIALCGGRPVAGLAEAAVPPGHSPTWTLYLASANVIRTAQLLRRWGGQLLAGPMTVPGRGRVFIGVDPTGAEIGFCQPTRLWRFHGTDPGSLYWAELDTWDGARADAFFADLFGYRQQQIGDGINVDYVTWSTDEEAMLGRLGMREGWADPDRTARWMLHFAVESRIGVDAAAHRVLALGGRVDSDPYDTEMGRIARVSDPSGAAFALIDSTDRVDAAEDLAAGSARVDDPYDD